MELATQKINTPFIDLVDKMRSMDNQECFNMLEDSSEWQLCVNNPDIIYEMLNFCDYWTEKDSKWVPLWKKQKTFEFVRRLKRWFRNVKIHKVSQVKNFNEMKTSTI